MNFFHNPNSDSPLGSISLIFGPMFSGKSTELLRRIRRYQAAKKTCLMIKYAKDCRYSDDEFCTHDLQKMKAVAVECLQNIKKVDLHQAEVIGIDEGQFFPDVVEFSEEMANQGKTVVISALDGDFRREPFGSVLQLIPKSEEVIKLSAVCTFCKGDAAYSRRITNETETEVIGGADKYVAACRRCFLSDDPESLRSTPKKGVKNVKVEISSESNGF